LTEWHLFWLDVLLCLLWMSIKSCQGRSQHQPGVQSVAEQVHGEDLQRLPQSGDINDAFLVVTSA